MAKALQTYFKNITTSTNWLAVQQPGEPTDVFQYRGKLEILLEKYYKFDLSARRMIAQLIVQRYYLGSISTQENRLIGLIEELIVDLKAKSNE